MRRLIVLTSVLGFALLVVSGCGRSPSAPSTTNTTSTAAAAAETNPAGDIPDTTVFVPFHAPSGKWSVSVPQGWARTDSGAAVVFTDKLNSIRLQEIPNTTAATEASVKTTEVPQLQAADPSVKVDTITTVTRKAGPAIETTYTHDSAPNPVTGRVEHDAVQRYDYFHNGTELVLTLAGPVGADNVDPWHTVTDSVMWTP
ncbi:hypothetical protein [Antrihabitans cavernicola]|uniref:Lipoprotein n=1 Tax=Antrihabitans cavernicola TaxID=2495913 RepID=A0A5A7S6F4_9NOCA|nr:hypothetical protein [Spelaeibacter cavernicola]KAA0016352.1 hypothetical protein FOY51_26395 [Spelaeibacter cavernicola]